MTEPIRVLHVVQRMEAAGVQALLMNIYRSIDRNKVQFDFLVHYTEPQFYDEEIKKMGGKIYKFSVREDYNFLKYKHNLDIFFKEHKEYKIVHGHMNSLGAIYLNAAEKASVPVRIAHAHNIKAYNKNQIIREIKKIMTRHYSNHATDLFACSEDAGKFMFGDKPFTVINNAIDSDLFKAKPEIRDKIRGNLGLDNNFVIGHVGRFHPQKNQLFLIDILYEIRINRPDVKLVLIGSGEDGTKIRAKIKQLELEENVIFLGNRSDMNIVYQCFDVFAFPSLFEGLGIAAIEAQSAGIPTVCTDTLPKEINVTPLIYRLPLEDPKQWAITLIKAAENPLAHQDMSHAIKEANFDISCVSEQLQQFYIKKYNQI